MGFASSCAYELVQGIIDKHIEAFKAAYPNTGEYDKYDLGYYEGFLYALNMLKKDIPDE